MTRIALAVLVLAGCATTRHDVPVLSTAAPGMKRQAEGVSRRHAVKVRLRPRPRATSFRVSRDLSRPVAHDWDAVAACESSGNWHANTGNGYYGGLQFTLSTWSAFGGRGRPDLTSEATQITVAERVLAVQGAGAWPRCGVYL